MSTSIKRKILLDARPSMEIEIYSAIPSVLNKIGRLSPEIMQSVASLENYVNGAIIQYYRIQEDEIALDKYMFNILNNQSFNNGDNFAIRSQIKFLDIHFYAICVDKVEKLYRKTFEKLSKQAVGAKNLEKLRNKKKLAEKQLELASKQISKTRNYLEHLDKEITDNNWSLSVETNESGSKFRLGKGANQVIADIDNIEQIKKAYEALVEYIIALPDVQ